MNISVIVPVYNVAKYLSYCLDSLINQTLKDIEIVCVNDGSTDNSLEILQDYAKKHSNIRIINQINKGLGAARNVGVANATGEYVGFLDSDDFVDVTAFEKLYKAAKENDADVVLTNFYLYYDDTAFTCPYRDMKLIHRLNACGAFTAEEHPEVLYNIGCWDKIYRRSFLIEKGITFPEKRIYEDVKYSYKALIQANSIVALIDRLFYYRKNTGLSITDKEVKNDSYKFDFIKNYSEIREEWKKRPEWKELYDEPITVSQIRDGYFHNSNISDKAVFKKFFLSMADIFDESEVKYIESIKDEKLISYAGYLIKRDWKTFYKQIKSC